MSVVIYSFGTAAVGTPDGECCHLFLWEEANVCQAGSPDSDPNLWQSVVSYLFVNVCQGSQKFRAVRFMASIYGCLLTANNGLFVFKHQFVLVQLADTGC